MSYKIVIIFFINIFTIASAKAIDLLSPNQKLKVTLDKQADNEINYYLQSGKETVLQKSTLGIHFYNNSKIINFTVDSKTHYGNYYSYVLNVFTNQISYKIELRLYNNAMVFRYVFDTKYDFIKLKGEYSAWTLPKQSKVWFFERDSDWKLKTYAGLWKRTSIDSLNTISQQGPIQGKPLVIEHNTKYIFLAEAALVNYSGLRFEAVNANTILANFSEGEKGFEVKGKSSTPWRLTYIANNLDELTKAREMIAQLNPKPELALFPDTSWIKPGRSVWSWWSRNKQPDYMSWAEEIKFIDYAHQLNFEYVVLDEGWEKWDRKWLKLKAYCKLAKSKKVNVWIWKHSDELKNADQMRLFLDSAKNAGVVGVKIDFFNGESKAIVDFEFLLLKECAKRQLMVNLHGCHPSTGESTTYPNEMTREGIRGIELNIMDQHLPSWHNAALPFTRMLMGDADYTPLAFSNPGKTTWAHQLATAYVFDSKVLVMADDPRNILENDSLKLALPFIKSIPVVWKKSIVLAESKIGELVSLLKIDDKHCYIIVLSGKDKSVKWKFDSKVLPAGDFDVELITDVQGHTKKMLTERWQIPKGGVIKEYNLEPNGGMVFKFSKINVQNN